LSHCGDCRAAAVARAVRLQGDALVKPLRRSLAAAALLACATSAHALGSCTTSASSTAFGSYNPLNAASMDSVGNVQVSCSLIGVISLNVPYTIALSVGSGGGYASRRLSGGGQALTYGLYTDPTRSTSWGDGSAGTSTVADGYLLGLITVNRGYSVYGRIPGGQNVAPANYADTVTVTVNY
jgi:spore coat protein U-like protein